MAVFQISKPPSSSDSRGKNVSQGENGAKRRSLVRALLVQHQTACLCLSVCTSLWQTTISFDMTLSSGLASTSDFTCRDGLWVLIYFCGSDKARWVKRSRPVWVCTWGARQQLQRPRNDSCEELSDQGFASKSVHGPLNAQWGNWITCSTKCSRLVGSVLQQKCFTVSFGFRNKG